MKKILRPKCILLWLVLFAFCLFILVEFICWLIYLDSFPARKDFYNETFSKEPTNWTLLDATYLSSSHGKKGVVKLSKDYYFAPSAMQSIHLKKMEQESFVFYMKVYVSSFTENTVTLGGLPYTTGVKTVVLNKKGYLGLATDLMKEASYSSNPLAKVKKNKWQDIYMYYNEDQKSISLYCGSVLALKKKNQTISLPLLEVWLGSVWVGGTNNFGSPKDIEYDQIAISNKGIIKKANFIEFIINQFI